MLYYGRKFDIRVWALVTDKVYFYNQGYIRTSSNLFTIEDTFNYVHLTNNCLQQYGDDYGKYEDGNTLSFEVLQEYLSINFPNYKISVKDHIIPRMKDLVIEE